MAKNIPSNENQRPATKATLPSMALNQDKRPNKEFTRQKTATRIYHHQNSIARYAKGTTLRRGGKTEREEHRSKGSKIAMNKYLSIITLNVNGLNAPMK